MNTSDAGSCADGSVSRKRRSASSHSCGRWRVDTESLTEDILDDVGLSLMDDSSGLPTPPDSQNGATPALKPATAPGPAVDPYSVMDDGYVPEGFLVYKRRRTGSFRLHDPFCRQSDEIILKIFGFLSKSMLVRCARVCRRWRQLAFDETLWRRMDAAGRTIPAGGLGRLVQRGVRLLRLTRAEEAVVSDADLTETDDGSSDEADETLELIDFGKSSDVAERAGSAGYDQVRVDRSSLASSVERQLQEPTTERPAPSGTKGGKQKRKKKYTEPPAPTAEELEATYKYEVLAPPDNSPVKLDFPASPQSQGEEHLSKHVPLTLYCDTCMAIAYQVHLSFAKFHSQVTRRPPTESEIYHLVSEACEHQRFREYGMLEVHGHRHISGPGCNQLEAEGGVKHSRGPWPRRLADRCEEVTEDIGEINMHNAWLEEQRDPERFKMYMCFGDPPRNYCQKYGHMDAAAEAAARERSRKPEDTETPIETANRLAREAEEAEKKRLAELDDSEQKDEL
ncbi:Marginal zone B- and B1-cell-specific protein [Amphibalanus amphitrite]|uniref:Marginal zone B-and B1-cell-specific protein n=1 Tax=Amphibalanus amphitrite TaxID=1232801 RepID=A0A6A4WBX5_AMPAM|nr:Marginal zone B- and B1-cell-specific protein [Amphibalanus amphitrite]KAF0301161.1 Marginal zone B- and B1-cell-specific protein [Amphibalanus amphitrite]